MLTIGAVLRSGTQNAKTQSANHKYKNQYLTTIIIYYYNITLERNKFYFSIILTCETADYTRLDKQ